MTAEDQAKLSEMDDLLDRFETLTPEELSRLEELGEWNLEGMRSLGMPIDELLIVLADSEGFEQ